jgi:hypothetical protein
MHYGKSSECGCFLDFWDTKNYQIREVMKGLRKAQKKT